MVSKVISIINKKNYKMVSKLVSKLANNILDSKLISKILIKTNLEYRVISS